MKKSMSSFLKRILAVALAMFMVFTSMPLPLVTYATETKTENEGTDESGKEVQTGNNQAVTVTITEASESETEVVPISGATVEYTISEELPNEETAVWTTVEGSTASDGTVTVLTENQEIVPTDTTTYIWLRVSAFGYKTNTVSENARVQLSLSTDSNNDTNTTSTTVSLEKQQLLTGIEQIYSGQAFSAAKENKTFLGEIKTKYEDAISVKYAVTTTAQTDSSEAETTGTEPSESDWSNQMPNITNAGTYTVWVKVLQTASEEDADNGENVGSNENANNNEENAKTGEDTENNENTGSEETVVWEETVTSVINKAQIQGISLTPAANLAYNGNAYELVILTGSDQLPSDMLPSWKVDGSDYTLKDEETVPTATIPGTYSVTFVASGNDNYETLTLTENVTIANGHLDTTGITVEGYSGTYDNAEHDAVSVTPTDGIGYTLKYQLHECTAQDSTTSECTHQPVDNAWSETIPEVKDAGSYIVWVKATQTHYEDADVDVTAGADAVAPFNVCIKQKKHVLSFIETFAEGEERARTVLLENGFDSFSGLSYNFGAVNEDDASDGIVYSVKEQGVDEKTGEVVLRDTQKASIDANGNLTVTDAGTYFITASLAGGDNYVGTEITYTLTVGVAPKTTGEFVVFKDSDNGSDNATITEIEYVLGTNDGVISELSASKMNANDNATISYDIDKKEIGISCDQQGKITVTDCEKLAQELVNSEDGTVEVIVAATKEADKDWKNDIRYQADSTSYKIIIKFAETPEVLYSLSESTGENGWYKAGDTVEVYAPENYTVSTTVTGFSTSVIFEDEGENERSVYLKNGTGEITAPIKVVDENNENLKIDTQKPDTQNMEIVFSGLNAVEKLGSQFGFFQAPVTITFHIEDEVNADESGLDKINWTYKKYQYATSSIMGDESGELDVVKSNDGSEYIATLTLPAIQAAQLCGNISFTATDKAGNISDLVENATTVVVDSEDSVLFVNHELADDGKYNLIGQQHNYSDNVKFTFEIEEANFFEDDVTISITKDDNPYEISDVDKKLTWTHEDEMHYGTLILSEEGDYIVSVKYKDNSGNKLVYKDGGEITEHTSETITIDKTAPQLDFNFKKTPESQIMTFTVAEHNFRAQDISISGSITDINGKPVGLTIEDLQNELRNATWTKDGDTYTYSSDKYVDAIYDLHIAYTDISSNEANTLNKGAFIIDHTAPTNVKIDYSKSILDTILETITFGFYKGDVTVTFTAHDYTAGVESFTWNYTKQNGASDVNRSTDEIDTIVRDVVQDANDKSKFTATVTLPNTDEKQLRGYLAAYATDTYGKAGTKVTDSGHIIVVDSIAPTMTAEYSVADRMVGTTSYYNDLAEVRFTVTEANFFAEDIVVTVSKDGGTAYAVKPKWTDVNIDTHVGTYTLTEDGDYVITVNYTDRSTNKMATYVSDTITIDTIQPVVEVAYQNTNVINTLKDRDGMDRGYFADTQTAIVTITEHNFNAEDVVFNIKATDVTGEELNVNNLHVKSEWKEGEKADTHVMTITYPGDANYTFDVEYADLATNEIADYAPDYFTVDNTAPVELDLTYSTSILETVLEALSFGFYNAKADVTLTADDAVSGVHGFMYSYENADGVSGVNAELINQAIAASEIEYSNDGMTATVEFEIPKDVLTASNQFNGTISFEATDRAGLKNTLKDNKRIVVDNIAPTAQVTYNEPVNREGTISYYDGNVDATVVVTEANFYAGDVVVSVTKDDGAPYVITPSWTDNNVDVHTGTFTLNEDGDYFITISYRDKSSNEMVVYTSEQLTIDTDIQEPTITFNGNNEDRMAYKGEIIPEISFTDVNYDSFEIFLYRTYMDAIDVDITEEKGIQNLFTISEETGSASLNVFDLGEDGKYDPNDDGIYRLLVTMQDKAGHTIEKEAYFTINRYGSVYAYDEYLVNLIADGGAYVTTVNEDLVITEYNADRLVTDSLNIEVTRDGKPLDNVEYTVSPNINENVSTGSSGWYQYEYVISKNNFNVDGIYKVYISSKDATGNNPENSNFEDKNILFYVDSTVPEITSITGLENAIVDNTELTISYTVFDAIGLKSIKVYVDDDVLQDVTDFSADFNNYTGSFTLEESEKERSIRIVVEDMAGNITDTASEEFTSAYAFNDGVTVTTNALVRFYANKPLFYRSIGGTAGVAGLAGFGIRRFRLRKKIK